MKITTYVVICIVVTILAWRIVVLERVSDIHTKTINVMLDTLERVVHRTQFLEGLSILGSSDE